MPRKQRQVPPEILTCPGCGESFPEHRRSVVWCSNMCRRVTKQAMLGECAVCGEENPNHMSIFPTIEDKVEARRRREVFAAEHLKCRAEDLKNRGRPLVCGCSRCVSGSDATPLSRSRPPSESKQVSRPTGYRKHFDAVVARDGWTCQICGVPVARDARPVDPFYPTLDHEIRVIERGSDDIDNLRLAHRWCNSAREAGPHIEDEATIAVRIRLTFPDRVQQLFDEYRR